MKFRLALLALAISGAAYADWSVTQPPVAAGVTSVSGTAPVAVATGTTTPVVSMHVSDSTHDGYLAQGDWGTFNGKQAAISATAPVTFSSNTVALPAATSSVDGYLAHADWATFNGKAASGTNADITALSHAAKIYPSADSTSAMQLLKADGATAVATVDTTNSRVGIGTATPGFTLDVKGATNATAMRVQALTGNTVAGFQVTGPNSDDSGIQLLNTGTPGANWWFRANSTNKFEFIDAGAGNTRLTIDSGGQVGIGSGTPGALLDVAAKFRVDSNGDPVLIRNVAYVWPASQGAASTLLQNDGSGNLSWASGPSNTSPSCAFLSSGDSAALATVTCSFRIFNGQVTALIPAISGTLSTGHPTCSACVPAGYRPVNGTLVLPIIVKDNGIIQGPMGKITISTAGTIDIFVNSSGGSFTGSSTVGTIGNASFAWTTD